MALQIHKLSQFLRGWGYLSYINNLIANAYQLSMDLDHWIRRRLRMCSYSVLATMALSIKNKHALK